MEGGAELKYGSVECVGPLRCGVEQTLSCALFLDCAHYGAGSSTRAPS